MSNEPVLIDLTKERENFRDIEIDGGFHDRKNRKLYIKCPKHVKDGEGALYIAQTYRRPKIEIKNGTALVDVPKELTTSCKISFSVVYPADETGHSEMSPNITVFFPGFSPRGYKREGIIEAVLPDGVNSPNEVAEATVLFHPSNKRYLLNTIWSFTFDNSKTIEFMAATLSPMNKIILEDRPTSFEVSVTKSDGQILKSGITQFRVWNIDNPVLTMIVPSIFPQGSSIRMNIIRYSRDHKKGEIPSYEVIPSAGKVSIQLEDYFLDDHIKVQLTATDTGGKIYYGPAEEWYFYEYISPIEPLSAHDPLNRLNLLGTDKFLF